MSEIELLRQIALLEEHVVELKTKLEWTEKLFGILWAHCEEGGTTAELTEMSQQGVAVMGWVAEAGKRCADTHYPDPNPDGNIS